MGPEGLGRPHPRGNAFPMGRISARGTSTLGDFTACRVGIGREEESRIHQQKAWSFPVSDANSQVPVFLGFAYFGGAAFLGVWRV